MAQCSCNRYVERIIPCRISCGRMKKSQGEVNRVGVEDILKTTLSFGRVGRRRVILWLFLVSK